MNSFINESFTFTSAFNFVPPLLITTNTYILSAFAFTCVMSFYVSCFSSYLHEMIKNLIRNFDVYVFYSTRKTQFCRWIIDIITTATTIGIIQPPLFIFAFKTLIMFFFIDANQLIIMQ